MSAVKVMAFYYGTAWGRLKVRSSIAALQTGRETNESRKWERERNGRECRSEEMQKFKRRMLPLSKVWGNVCVFVCVCEREILYFLQYS